LAAELKYRYRPATKAEAPENCGGTARSHSGVNEASYSTPFAWPVALDGRAVSLPPSSDTKVSEISQYARIDCDLAAMPTGMKVGLGAYTISRSLRFV
jgi:hypothetical protein